MNHPSRLTQAKKNIKKGNVIKETFTPLEKFSSKEA